jgi:translation initiation factor IF-1
LAFVAGKARLTFAHPSPGEKIMLELSPYDLSEGRVLVKRKI